MYDATWCSLDGVDQCARAVCDEVSKTIDAAISSKGHATLALSGGSTPRPMLVLLARAAVDWSRVTVTLVDDRWCSHDDRHSNFGMITELLSAGAAGATRLVPMVPSGHEQTNPEAAAAAASQCLRRLGPADVMVLGMGSDGHTASWIPGSSGLAAALGKPGEDDAAWVRVVVPTDGRHRRLTLTRTAVGAARRRLVHLTGAKKRVVLEEALSGTGDWERLPIRAALSEGPVTIFYGGDGS